MSGNHFRVCGSCGSIHDISEDCKCKKDREQARREWKREYQKQYDEENEEVVKPLKTKRWQVFRRRIIDRDDGHCQRCLIKFGIINGEDLQVHHIKPRIQYPELIFDKKNVITMCGTCNRDIGTAEELDFEPNTNKMNDEMEPNI